MKSLSVLRIFLEFWWLFVSAAMVAMMSIYPFPWNIILALASSVAGVCGELLASYVAKKLSPPSLEPSVWTPARIMPWWGRELKGFRSVAASIIAFSIIMAVIGYLDKHG